MTFRKSHLGLMSAAALLLAGACSNSPTTTSLGAAGSGAPGTAGSAPGTAGASTPGSAGATTPGSAGNTAGGTAGAVGGTAGAVGGTAGAVGTAGVSGGTAGADGGSPSGDDGGQQATRPINVMGTGVYQGNGLYLNKSKPAQGKLVLLLGGICTGTGAGGFESFVHQYGFHVYAPMTDTCLDGGKVPAMYQTTLKTMPNDPEANRQIGDSRMELWDGKDRVSWYSVAPGKSIQEETIAALTAAEQSDPGGDWTWFLNADGTLRTTDVWVVGYSWGSQTWAMISAYVNFGRVITTSGPQDEGFPNATWITSPPATGTPGDRKYILAGFQGTYPSTSPNDSGVMSMFTTVTKAGWPGTPTNVLTTSPGPYTASQHLFAMVGSNNVSPGGHTVFCNDNQMNGWIPLCKYVLGQQ